MEEPSGDPGIVDLKLHDKQAVGLEQLLRSQQGLASVDVVIDADIREMRSRGVRIEKRENDEIKLIVTVLDVAAGIVERDVNFGRLIGMLEVQFAAEFQDEGIDLDGLDATGAVAKG